MTVPQDVARQRLEDELARLEALRASLSQDLADEAANQDSELSSIDQHPGEAGTEVHDFERDLSIAESVERELEDVHAALRRLDGGSYGRCEVDGEPIPDERLEAMPATRLCAAHQTAVEHA